MGKKQDLDNCKTAQDFIRYGKQNGAYIAPGSRHIKICTEKGIVPIPNHKGDLKKGTCYSIRKMMIAIGLGSGLIAFFIALI
jgi:hypothetical protein